MNTSVTVSAQLVNVLMRYMQAESLYDETLSKRLNDALSAERVPIDEWWTLLDSLARLHPAPALGVRLGQLIQLEDIGVLGYLAASCETLSQALQRLQRFQPLLHNMSFSWAELKGEHLYFCWDHSGGRSTAPSNEMIVAGLLTVLNTLVAPHKVAPIRVTFRNPGPERPVEHERLFGCEVAFSCPQFALIIPAADIELPINSRDPHLLALMDQQAEAFMATVPKPDDFLEEFQRYLLQGLEEGQLSMGWLSERLGIPLRSLYRALETRGYTYKEMLDDLRLQLAQRYLADPALSLSEIALMLGYSEHSAFTRAFKAWTGRTPLRFRRQLQSAADTSE